MSSFFESSLQHVLTQTASPLPSRISGNPTTSSQRISARTSRLPAESKSTDLKLRTPSATDEEPANLLAHKIIRIRKPQNLPLDSNDSTTSSSDHRPVNLNREMSTNAAEQATTDSQDKTAGLAQSIMPTQAAFSGSVSFYRVVSQRTASQASTNSHQRVSSAREKRIVPGRVNSEHSVCSALAETRGHLTRPVQLAGYTDLELVDESPSVGSSLVDRLEPLFESSWHEDITTHALQSAGCDFNECVKLTTFSFPGYTGVPISIRKAIEMRAVTTDLDHFFVPDAHAQAPTWGGFASNLMWTIKNTRCDEREPGKDPQYNLAKVVNSIGILTHTIQDLYSHTDWIEGDQNMSELYVANTPDRESMEMYLRAFQRLGVGEHDPPHPHHRAGLLNWSADTFPLSRIEDGPSQINDLEYYTGGILPPSHFSNRGSLHNRFAADDIGRGRGQSSLNLLFNNYPLGLGDAAFCRARNGAMRATIELIHWVYKKLHPSCKNLVFCNCDGAAAVAANPSIGVQECRKLVGRDPIP